jgi:hypothetical protein
MYSVEQQNTKELAVVALAPQQRNNNILCCLYSVAFSCLWLAQLAWTSQERGIMC